jgi:hypothetical protein
LAFLLAGSNVSSLKPLHEKYLRKIEAEVIDDDGDDDAIADRRPMIIYLGMDIAGLREFARGIDRASGHQLKTFQNHFRAHDERQDGFCDYIALGEIPAMNVSTNGISVRWRPRKYHNSTDCGLHAVLQYSMSTASRPLAALTRLNYQAFLSSPLCDTHNHCGWAAFEALDQLTNAYPNAHYVHGSSNYTVARMPPQEVMLFLRGITTRSYLPSMGWSRQGVRNLKDAYGHIQNLFDDHIKIIFSRRRELKYFHIDWDQDLRIGALGTYLNMKNITLDPLAKPPGVDPSLLAPPHRASNK